MPAKGTSQRNLSDQIDELKRKIQLIDGERQAYHEAAEKSIKQNRERIAELKRENKELRKDNADKLAADEKVVKTGLRQNPEESKALKSKPSNVAVVLMDDKVQDKVSALNAARHVTKKKQEYLDSLKKRKQQQRSNGKENDGKKCSTDADSGDDSDGDDVDKYSKEEKASQKKDGSDEAETQRNLENRLDKSNLKCKEAEHIQRTYQQIKSKLEDEQQTFETTLDNLEREIQRMKHQLKDLHVMHDDACLVRDKAKEDLSRFEAEIHEDRRRREVELEALKQERLDQELRERTRATRLGLGQDAGSEQRQITGGSDEDQVRLMQYESEFREMKQVAGVSDTRKLVERFHDQGEKQKELKALMESNEQTIEKLSDRKEELQQEYDEKKFTGEEAITRGESLVAAEEVRASEEEEKRAEALEELEKSSKLLTGVKFGIEHLVEKLKSFKQGEETAAAAADEAEAEDKDSLKVEDFLLNQLKICDNKLTRLMEELSSLGQEETEMNKKMKDDDFYTTTELKLPAYNTRIKLPAITNQRDYGDDNMSGDEGAALTRQELKKQSQMIIESKTRRRPSKRKKRIGK